MWVANVGREWELQMGVAKWGRENKKLGADVIGILMGVII